jgi:hypothetical protein
VKDDVSAAAGAAFAVGLRFAEEVGVGLGRGRDLTADEEAGVSGLIEDFAQDRAQCSPYADTSFAKECEG